MSCSINFNRCGMKIVVYYIPDEEIDYYYEDEEIDLEELDNDDPWRYRS